MADAKVGDLLDARGLTLDLDEGDFVVSAVVIAAVMAEGESSPTLTIGSTDGMGAIELTGLISAAKAIDDAGWIREKD